MIEHARNFRACSNDEDVEMGDSSTQKRESAGDQFPPSKFARSGDGDAEDQQPGVEPNSGAAGTTLDDVPAQGAAPKFSRLSPESNPSSGGQLFGAHNAGSIVNVRFGHADDDCWEKDILKHVGDDLEIQSDDVEEDEVSDEGKLPVVSDQELEALDVNADFTEIQRLLSMVVLRTPSPEELDGGNVSTPRMVFDWRIRNGK